MATKNRKNPLALAATLFVVMFTAFLLLLLVPQTRDIASTTFHRAKLTAIDWGLFRYNHPMDESHDRANSLGFVARAGQIHRLDFVFDFPLSSAERLRIFRLDIPQILMMIETGERTEVLVFVNDAQTLKEWEKRLEAIQAEHDDATR